MRTVAEKVLVLQFCMMETCSLGGISVLFDDLSQELIQFVHAHICGWVGCSL